MKYLIIFLLLFNSTQANKLSHNNKEVEIKVIEENYPNPESDSFSFYIATCEKDTFIIVSKNPDKIDFSKFDNIEVGSTYKLRLKLVSNLNDFINGKAAFEKLDKAGWVFIYFRPKDPKKEKFGSRFDTQTGKIDYNGTTGILVYPGLNEVDNEINYKLQIEKRYGDTVSFYLYYTSQEILGKYILKSSKVNQ